MNTESFCREICRLAFCRTVGVTAEVCWKEFFMLTAPDLIFMKILPEMYW